MVSEAFLHFFVRTVGHYSSYVKRGRNGEPAVFEKRKFYKAIDSKTTRHFVKKFIQTQMFDLFIQEVEQQQLGPQQGEGYVSRCPRWQKHEINLYSYVNMSFISRKTKVMLRNNRVQILLYFKNKSAP